LWINASGGQKPFREKVSGLPKAFGSEKIFQGTFGKYTVSFLE